MTAYLSAISFDNDDKWDDFVLHHKRGSIYHLSTWREVLQRSYGYQPLYIAVQNAAHEFVGLQPFMLVKSMLTGQRLVSLPFSSFCGLLVSDVTLPEVVDFSLAQHPRAEYLEIKLAGQGETLPDFLEKESSYMTHLLDLTKGESALLKGFHATSVRQRIVKAGKNPALKLRMAQSEEDLKNFFKLHTQVRRKHGLPPHPYSFFVQMWRLMAPKKLLQVPFIEYDGKMIAAAVVFKYKDTVSYEYSACDENYLHLSVNQLLAWEVIRMACSEGFGTFDFGRSSLQNESLIEYKERWGAQRLDLNYYYYANTRRNVRKPGVEGSLSRRLLSRANRMLPDALLQLEGEYLYRHLG